MKKVILVLGLVFAVAACNPSPGGGNGERDLPAPIETEPEEVHELNIGDVEQGLCVEASLAPESDTLLISKEKFEGRRDMVLLLKLTVRPPYPEHLWIEYDANCNIPFPDRPVILRGKIVADKTRELGSFAVVLGEDARASVYREDTPPVVRVDALAGLETIPKSIVITPDSIAFLMPAGTDPAELDPETGSAEDKTKALYQTTVRIEFESAADAAHGESP